MLGTVILDAYSADRVQEMAEAIDWLCPPDPSGPFAASGLYAFWNVTSRELLYIGRSNDLGVRFRQHNGLMPCPPAACKVEQIRSHFEATELLGYTAYPQSPIDQPHSARARRPYRGDLEARAALADLAGPGEEELANAEGQLIGAYLNRHRELPPWNKVRGSLYGAARATADTAPLLDIFRARFRCSLNSRLMLRALADDAEACRWENLLHVARYQMAYWGGAISDELLRAEVERLAQGPEWSGARDFEALLDSGYLDRRPRAGGS